MYERTDIWEICKENVIYCNAGSVGLSRFSESLTKQITVLIIKRNDFVESVVGLRCVKLNGARHQNEIGMKGIACLVL